MSLYNHTITIFNYDYQGEIFYPTLINNVECQYFFGINRLPEYNTSSDRCLCIIKYNIINNLKTSDGQTFLIKDDWVKNDNKRDYFTIQTDKDFFALGDYSNLNIDNYEDFKNEYSHKSFLINEYRDFESIIPHWELYGG